MGGNLLNPAQIGPQFLKSIKQKQQHLSSKHKQQAAGEKVATPQQQPLSLVVCFLYFAKLAIFSLFSAGAVPVFVVAPLRERPI